MSLISALMSLIFGCLYVIRFETLRRPHNAMQWAPDALSTRNPWWNVLVLLALPFVWLAWYAIAILLMHPALTPTLKVPRTLPHLPHGHHMANLR
jgi:hypothetical protein